MAEAPKLRAFIYTLKENAEISLEKGIVGHATVISNDPLRAGNGTFFIGVSRKGVIYGPFQQLTAQSVCNDDLGFVRLYYEQDGVSLVRSLCPYRFSFSYMGQPAGTKKPPFGIEWSHVAGLFGLDVEGWKNLKSVSLTDEQIEVLSGILAKINGEESPPDWAIDFEDIPSSVDDWRTRYTDQLSDDQRSEWDESDVLEWCFGGDRASYEAFLERETE